jgi:hypothetical protein
VTIGAGFVCPDGIVIAADTKESYGEGDHAFVNKIELVRHFLPETTRPKTEAAYAAIVGSGHAYLVNHIATHIKRIFVENVGVDIHNFRTALTDLMPKLYAGEAFSSYPRSDASDLYTEFLVAVRPNYRENVALFQITSSLVEEVHTGVRIIGCGAMQETGFELATMNLNMYDSATAALFLVYEAKRHYSYVGGLTHIYSIPNNPGPVHGHPPEAERRIDQGLKEYLFTQLRGWHHQIVVAAGSPYVSDEAYSSILNSFHEDVGRILNEFRVLETRQRERDKEISKEQAKQFQKVMEAIDPRQE